MKKTRSIQGVFIPWYMGFLGFLFRKAVNTFQNVVALETSISSLILDIKLELKIVQLVNHIQMIIKNDFLGGKICYFFLNPWSGNCGPIL